MPREKLTVQLIEYTDGSKYYRVLNENREVVVEAPELEFEVVEEQEKEGGGVEFSFISNTKL